MPSVISYSTQTQFNPDTYRPIQDVTGTLAANRVSGERQTLTAGNGRDQQYIVPLFAPFYGDANTFSIVHQPSSGAARTLVLGIDYAFVFMFIGASRGTAKPIYAGISFMNRELAGTLTLAYNTLGGNWVLNRPRIDQILADNILNPRTVAYEQISNIPTLFPIVDHPIDLENLKGTEEIAAVITDIALAIANRPVAAPISGLAAHLADTNNPHQNTAEQLGLEKVMNWAIATLEEARAGTANLYISAAVLKGVIDGLDIQIEDATNEIKGISSLNLGNLSTDPTNSTDALTAVGMTNLLGNTGAANAQQNALVAALKRLFPLSATAGNQLSLLSDGLYYGLTAPADVADIYVDRVNGNDINPGTRALPMRTMTAAINRGPSGVNRNLYLREGQNHLTSVASPTVFRGGNWVIMPYGPGLDAIPATNPYKYATVQALNLNTWVYGGDWVVDDLGAAGLLQRGASLYPSQNATIRTYGINFRCGSPVSSSIPIGGADGSFHSGTDEGAWAVFFGRITMPHANSRFISNYQVSDFNLTLGVVLLQGSGKLAIPTSKAFTFDWQYYSDYGSTNEQVRAYLNNPVPTTLVYNQFNTNLPPPTPPSTNGTIPVGGMIEWWGGVGPGDIPAGWALCDGTNGTPDRRGRVAIGAGGALGFNKGDTGGFADGLVIAHNHTASSSFTGSALGDHNHSLSSTFTGNTLAGHNHGATSSFSGGAMSGHTHGATSSFSGNSMGEHTHGVNDGQHNHSLSVANGLGGGGGPVAGVNNASTAYTDNSSANISIQNANIGTPSGSVSTSIDAASAGTPTGSVSTSTEFTSAGTPSGSISNTLGAISAGTPSGAVSTTVATAGESATNANLPPYIAINWIMFKGY